MGLESWLYKIFISSVQKEIVFQRKSNAFLLRCLLDINTQELLFSLYMYCLLGFRERCVSDKLFDNIQYHLKEIVQFPPFSYFFYYYILSIANFHLELNNKLKLIFQLN